MFAYNAWISDFEFRLQIGVIDILEVPIWEFTQSGESRRYSAKPKEYSVIDRMIISDYMQRYASWNRCA